MSNPNTQPSPNSITCLIKRDIDELLSDSNVIYGQRVLHDANKEQIACEERARFVMIHDREHGIKSIWRISVTVEPDNNVVTRVETGLENDFVGTYVVDNEKDALVLVHLGEQGVVLPVYKADTLHMEMVDNSERLGPFHKRLKECVPIDNVGESNAITIDQAHAILNSLGAIALGEDK